MYVNPLSAYNDTFDLLRLARTENVGPISFFHLLKRFGCPKEALKRLPDRGRVSTMIPSLDDIKREIEAHQKKGAKLISYYDPIYPAALRTLKDPPPFLSAIGDLSLLHRTTFSVVGARNASQAGERLAQQISTSLAEQKWSLVSGLARGIDTVVHQTSLETGTVAVIAGGLDHVYPPENKKLFQEISEKGLILSEDPFDQQPHAGLFPKRNRIISGLCWGTLIIEAGLKSGSLLTAQYALEQDRALFAVPGHPLDPRSKGTNRLLKQGAILVENAQDILEESAAYKSRIHLANEPEEEYTTSFISSEEFCVNDTEYDRLKEALTTVPTSVADLASHLCLSPIVVRSMLIELELDGLIERYPGDAVILVPSCKN
jgi:DNA processing protein